MQKKQWTKPFPGVDQDNDPFWQGLKRHEFLLFRCKKCGAWYWPVSFCRNCDNEPFFGNLEWVKVSGKGKVFNFNIVYRPGSAAYKDDVPYVFAIIQMDEGPHISSTIIDCDPIQVKIDMPVEVVFKDITTAEYENVKEDFTLPYFRLVG